MPRSGGKHNGRLVAACALASRVPPMPPEKGGGHRGASKLCAMENGSLQWRWEYSVLNVERAWARNISRAGSLRQLDVEPMHDVSWHTYILCAGDLSGT